MKFAALRPLLFSLFSFAAAGSALAQQPAIPEPEKKAATPAAPQPAAPAPTSSEVVELPKIQVTARQLKQLDKEIKRLDKIISREKEKLNTSSLDRALNNDKAAKAAAIFGGNSASHMQVVQASRIAYYERERELTANLKEPRTVEETKMIEEMLEQIRKMRRELDVPGAN